ncbi:GT4 family glycosyltransferase PelF [Thermocrinis minervae]|uniref:Glycosyltransferase involved in cell wall bisynthesis n=1 Tax=Thermocrinis minervae TaxID=381751 RepID=A0A1M6Q917_9AQUI|nr:GT4 family glycosyltransferase PelF [Thermocrinis minervae]SHK16784.1 Glycosyltransferase involved in cell wall bisynthesis [Thermocrinis minervae]
MSKVDVLMLCEGTYPYIGGGVSSWIHSLVSGLQDFTFGIIFLGALREMYGEAKYKIPQNVKFVKAYYMFEKSELPPPKEVKMPKVYMQKIRELVYWFKGEGGKWSLEEIYKLLENVRLEHFLYSPQAWEFIVDEAVKYPIPFVDYFWTLRNMHIPIWIVHDIARNIDVDFGLLHSPSTGYAGLLGTFLKSKTGKPLIIHEHGIYVRERKLDIYMAEWIRDFEGIGTTMFEESYLRKMWVNFFLGINRLIYHTADIILSLFEDARRIQIEFGAPPEKTMVLPNGVDLRTYQKAYESRPKDPPPIVALIGRVVPIKDVRTFIRACKVFTDKMPQGECWVVGPEDEDPDYALSCKELVSSLGLENKVKFLGFQKTVEILAKVGLVALTSVSEGMPLSILEAYAAGLPVVTTDVGSCRQLVEGGLDEEDIKLGKAGVVCPVADPYCIGMAFYELLSNKDLWSKCQEVALKRVQRYYTIERFLENYRKLYRSFLDGRDRV